MKKIWIKPMATVEEFAANEYVAACGDKNTVYKFVCDAPGGILCYYPESDDNIDGNYTGRGDAELVGLSYTPCDKKHDAPTSDEYYDGYVRSLFGKSDVIVWVERDESGEIVNGHATKQLDMEKWETAKS